MGGFSSKLNDLSVVIDEYEYDVIAFSETWLHEHHFTEELFNTADFSVFRVDRMNVCKDRGGGVLLAVRRSIVSSAVDLDLVVAENVLHIDQVCVRIASGDCCAGDLLLFLCYIPPHSNYAIYKRHLQNIENVISNFEDKNVNICVLGDFNVGSLHAVFLQKLKWQ